MDKGLNKDTSVASTQKLSYQIYRISFFMIGLNGGKILNQIRIINGLLNSKKHQMIFI